MKLKDRIIVITGGSKGLGRSLAELFIAEEAHVIISARDNNELERVATEMSVDTFASDVTKEEDVQQLAKYVLDKYGRIDIWINNAGTRIPHGPVEDIDMKRFHEMLEVNLFGVVYGSKAAIIPMRQQKQGVIITILSTSALTGRPNSAAYAASKYAAMGFSKSLREGVRDDGITVVDVYPGGMRTNFFDEQKPDNYDQYMDPKLVARGIVSNLKNDTPEEELILKRPGK